MKISVAEKINEEEIVNRKTSVFSLRKPSVFRLCKKSSFLYRYCDFFTQLQILLLVSHLNHVCSFKDIYLDCNRRNLLV